MRSTAVPEGGFEEHARARVSRVLNEAFAAGRLAQSGATQADLWRIQEACIEALKDELREEAQPLQENFEFARDRIHPLSP